MSRSPLSFLLFAGLLMSATATAQCPIKDSIMSQIDTPVVDGTTGATEHHHPDDVTGATTPMQGRSNDKKKKPHKHQDPDHFHQFRLGGYGEAVAAFKDYGINRFYGGADGNPRTHRNTISIPRFVLALDYKFSKNWILGAEIEFESGGTGQAVELENTENGEYETEIEKGGEVAIEQFHITRLITPTFNLRAGHMIVPVGLTNAHHEPMNFFGTVRPEGERMLLPCTWHETGLAAFGRVGSRAATFDYQVMVVAGLNANGFDRNTWVASGKQGLFEEDNFTSPGYAARLDWVGVKGLRVGASYYYCHDTSANSDKPSYYGNMGRAPLSILSGDAQYTDRYVTARGCVVWGNLAKSDVISSRNGRHSNASPYSRVTPVAKNAMSCGGEVGVNLRNIINCPTMPELLPFVRYEYYNPQEKVLAPHVADQRLKTSMWTMGLNYRVGNGIILKADYTTRSIGSGRFNSENEFALGIAFTGWFLKK